MRKIFCSSDGAVSDLLELLDKEEYLALDTETDGLNPHINKLWSIQIGDRETALLFPYQALSEKSRNILRDYLRTRTIIAFNAKFDLKFLFVNGFDIAQSYDCYEVEKILFAGKYFTFRLKDVLLRRFQVQMDKEPRAIFYSDDPKKKSEFQLRADEVGDLEAWDEETINYAIGDIEYLHEIMDGQLDDAKVLGMANVSWLENHLVPVVAKMENRGVMLDYVATKKFLSRVSLIRDELKQKIFALLEKNYNISWKREYSQRVKIWDLWKQSHEEIKKESNKFRVEGDRRKKTSEALSMVASSEKKKPYAIKPRADNPFSPTSPLKLQQALTETVGFPVTTTGKEWLEENIHLHEAIADLVEFRKFDKLCQFCELTEDINVVTGLIHAEFHQNGTKSGRFSCSNPNLQQIPSKTDEAKEFRALFKPEEGYKFVGADLAGIELVIIAYFSEEQILIDAINKNLDVHCFTMSLFLGCDYPALVALKKGLNMKDKPLANFDSVIESRRLFEEQFSMPELAKKESMSEWVKALRDYTKTLTYGLAYGLSEFGLSRKFHCSFEDAQSFISKFFISYPNLKKFLHIEEELGWERKYAVNPLGRRRWFSSPRKKSYEELEKEVIKSLDKQKRLWDSVSDEEWDNLMSKAIQEEEKALKGKINSVKRQAGNFFPQSMCADMVKLAMIRFEKNFVGEPEEGLIITVHDELIVKAKSENSEHASKILEECMIYAVHKFMPDIVVNVDAKIMDKWEK